MAIAVFAVSFALLAGPRHAEAAASGSSAFDINFGDPVVVGQTVPYAFAVVNASTFPNGGDTVLLTSITGYPSCDAIELSDPVCNTASNQNAGTFSPAGSGTGLAGTACAGVSFTVTENAAGLWTFTPAAPITLGPSNVGGLGAQCVILGDANVTGLPADDADAGTPGIQTFALSDARGTNSPSGLQFRALGSSVITVLEADIEVTKTPAPAAVCVGASVTYTFVVSNPGTVALTNVTVVDNVLGDLTADFVAANGASSTLAVGASVTFTKSHTPALGSTTNTVTATGTANGVSATDTTTATVVASNCDIEITKTPAPTSVCVGASVTYTFVVSNPGTIALTSVTVVDNVLGTLTADFVAANGGSSTLAAGASVTFTKSHTPTLGSTTNTVTATGTANGVSATDTATATVTAQTCDIDVTKTPNQTLVCVGTAVTYTFVVSNPGNVALTSVTVVDNVIGSLTADFVAANGGSSTLAAGASVTFTKSHTPTLGVTTNTVTATGSANGATSTATATATVTAEECGGGEGCTPGFWKTHPQLWVGYTPSQLVGSVFTGTISSLANQTLLQALGNDGGPGIAGAQRILIRAAIASLLNAAHPDVDFDMTQAEIIADVNAAIASGNRATMLTLAGELDTLNNLGCSIDAHGDPI